VQIAQRCNLEIELGKSRLPAFPTPSGMSVDDYLREQALAGFARKEIECARGHRRPDLGRHARQDAFAELREFGVDLDAASAAERRGVERRWGILFQQGALFSSLTVRQNIQFPVREYLKVSQRLLDEIMVAKLGMVGLKPEVADRFPSELSGGMVKRVALARALALDPELVFLDEPTSGLDPIGAGDFDELVRTLQRTLGLTVFMVTHDLDSLHTACDRIAVLGNGKIIAAGSIADMQASQHPWLRQYFHGKRARAVMG